METQYTIMVIEDDKLIREALKTKLTLNGFMVTACSNGGQALDVLSKSIELPDAICLDYYLPDMKGDELMGMLSKNETWSNIPVLILSNADEEESIKNTLALGAKIYMLKTQYKMEDIVVQLRKILSPNS